MAVDNHHNITPDERLNKIAQIVNKGIYLYYQKTNGKTEEVSQEKEGISISETKNKDGIKEKHKIYLNEKILTIKELTEFLKISRTTLWRLRRCGEIPYCIISNRRLIRFKLSEILSCIATKNSLDRKIFKVYNEQMFIIGEAV